MTHELDGYRVVSPAGRVLGTVAGATERSLVVLTRRWGRATRRTLPKDYALVWTRMRTVVAQVTPEELRRAPAVPPGSPPDDSTTASFYGLEQER